MRRFVAPPRDFVDKSITYHIPINSNVNLNTIKHGVIVIKNKNPLKGENAIYTVHEVNLLMKEYREKLDERIEDILQSAYNMNDKKVFMWLWNLLSRDSDEPFSHFGQKNPKDIGYIKIISLIANRPNINIKDYPQFFPNIRDIVKREEWKYFSCMNTHVFNMYFDIQGVMLLDQFDQSRVYSLSTQSYVECVDYWSHKKKTSSGDSNLDPGTELYTLLNRDDGFSRKNIILDGNEPVEKLVFEFGMGLYIDTSYKGCNSMRKYMKTGISKCHCENDGEIITATPDNLFTTNPKDFDFLYFRVLTNLITDDFHNSILIKPRAFAMIKNFTTRNNGSINYVNGNKSVTESYLQERKSRNMIVGPLCKKY